MKKAILQSLIGCCLILSNQLAAIPQKITNFGKAAFVNKLPSKLNESSALVFFRDKLWTLNDGGGEAAIYAVDMNGDSIWQTIKIKDAVNTDWEELAQDGNYFYIGDFGNNYGTRRNLTIYKVRKSDIPLSGDKTIPAEIIGFSYKNQPKTNLKKLSAYDMEAMIVYHDTIVLFSKNWVDENSSVYELPAKPGNYELSPIKTLRVNSLVTGATLSEDQHSILLIGYREFVPLLIAINNFSLSNITLKHSYIKVLQNIAGQQTEGVTFINDSTAMFSSESTILYPNSLFKISVKK